MEIIIIGIALLAIIALINWLRGLKNTGISFEAIERMDSTDDIYTDPASKSLSDHNLWKN